ncbi:unnamed protein product [Ambrosiozyma monospora]|uniref:Unnamed protein product n=1 Tax=Ambrosiozyma monospora TaxID=43982 RepID=A0ACB5TMY0_AMBMO|nr:unnamed protein product [Ambrosiozyma monospora]
MALSLKRAAELDKENVPNQALKRPCLLNSLGALGASHSLFVRDPALLRKCYSSSEDELSDCNSKKLASRSQRLRPRSKREKKLRNQRRNQRNIKKSLVSTTPFDLKLSKAVAQYSDDEDEYQLSPAETDYMSSNFVAIPKTPVRNNHVSTGSIGLPSPAYDSTPNKLRNFLPESDFSARCRCFDYLVGAIDEAWARYCDATSYEEDEVYGYDSSSAIPQTPVSVVSSDDDEGYRSEMSTATSITDYESDFQPVSKPSFSIMNVPKMSSFTRRVSEVPSNVRLQQLKDRLIKSKNGTSSNTQQSN